MSKFLKLDCNETYSSRQGNKRAQFHTSNYYQGKHLVIFCGDMTSYGDIPSKCAVMAFRDLSPDNNKSICEDVIKIYHYAFTLLNHFQLQQRHIRIRLVGYWMVEMEHVSRWNKAFTTANGIRRKLNKSEFVIIEDWIGGQFIQFISESGAVLPQCPVILKQFADFVHLVSEGAVQLADLKGAIKDNETILLTVPCFLKTNQNYSKTNAQVPILSAIAGS